MRTNQQTDEPKDEQRSASERETPCVSVDHIEGASAHRAMADQWETTDVLICGCGPTGAMLSAFLGRANVANVVLEKEPGITTDPRGIALDDDGIRLLQGLGLYDAVFSDIGSCTFAYSTRLVSFPLRQILLTHKMSWTASDFSRILVLPGANFVGGVHHDFHKRPLMQLDAASVRTSPTLPTV